MCFDQYVDWQVFCNVGCFGGLVDVIGYMCDFYDVMDFWYGYVGEVVVGKVDKDVDVLCLCVVVWIVNVYVNVVEVVVVVVDECGG